MSCRSRVPSRCAPFSSRMMATSTVKPAVLDQVKSILSPCLFWRAEPDAEVAVLDAVDMDGVGAEWGDDLQLVCSLVRSQSL